MPRWILVFALGVGTAVTALLIVAGGTDRPGGGLTVRAPVAGGALAAALVIAWGVWRTPRA